MFYSSYGQQMISRAEAFATAAHEAVNQKRKFTDEPYIVHPRAVASVVQRLQVHSWEQIVLAWLHDTVEDTGVTRETIRIIFGSEIADGIYYLTNVERSAGNRRERHRLNVQRLRLAPANVQTVKVADIFDNTKDIAALAPDFAPVFLAEKDDVMEALRNADPALWAMTMAQIENQKKELKHGQKA